MLLPPPARPQAAANNVAAANAAVANVQAQARRTASPTSQSFKSGVQKQRKRKDLSFFLGKSVVPHD